MNLLEFVEMSVAETLVLSIACLLVLYALSGIGSLFVKEGERVLCLQSAAGLALVSILTLIVVSFFAVAAKYIIYICIGVSLMLVVRNYCINRPSMRSVVRAILPTLIIYTCFVALLVAYIFTHQNIVDYNCHMIYGSAIPEEIYKADYFSRLRIVDVYPHEWSKFHMFNGCMSAIPLAVFPLKNIITFNLAKYATIALLVGAIFEGILRKDDLKRSLQLSTVLLLIFIVCANRFIFYSFFTNNYSSFLFMAIMWLCMRAMRYSYAAMFSLVLAVSTSKSTITGFIFFLYSTYMIYRANDSSIRNVLHHRGMTILYCLVAGIGCIVMIVSGEHPANEDLVRPSFLANATDPSWITLFFFGDSITHFFQTKQFGSLGIEIMMPIFYLVVLILHREKIKHFVKSHFKIIAYTVFLVSGLYLMYWMQSNNNILALRPGILVVPLKFAFLYLLPLTCLFVCCERNMYTPLQLFVIFAFVQLMTLNADNGACNYCLVMFPLALYISECLVSLLDRIPSKLSGLLLIAVFCGSVGYGLTHKVYRLFVWGGENRYQSTLELSPVEYLGDKPFEYYDSSDAQSVMLNSLKGNRIHYNNIVLNPRTSELEKLSMSMRFVPQSDYENSASERFDVELILSRQSRTEPEYVKEDKLY